MYRVPVRYYPRIILPRKKVHVYIEVFESPHCPFCVELLHGNCAWNRALKKVADKVELHIITWDVSTERGAIRADAVGVEYTPCVFVNGRKVPNDVLGNEEILEQILLGKPFPCEERDENYTPIVKRNLL